MTLNEAIERFYALHPGTTPVEEGSPHERPHKPLLLLEALDLIDEAKARPDNDYLGNGDALCKNHRWLVCRLIDARRSTGRNELDELTGKSLLLSKDPAFQPNAEGLSWRCDRLSA